MKKSIQYSANVKWLEPFVESAYGLVPLERLAKIKGYRVRSDLKPDQQGQIIKTLPNGKSTITLKVMDYDKKEKKYRNSYIGTILEILAHELAHLIYWEHTPDHFRLQSQIQVEFANVLVKLNINDTGIEA